MPIVFNEPRKTNANDGTAKDKDKAEQGKVEARLARNTNIIQEGNVHHQALARTKRPTLMTQNRTIGNNFKLPVIIDEEPVRVTRRQKSIALEMAQQESSSDGEEAYAKA